MPIRLSLLAAAAAVALGAFGSVYASVSLTVAKQFSPTIIAVGGTSTLAITFGNANLGAGTLTSAFGDIFPTNLVIASPPNIGGTCPGTINATAGSNSLAMTNGSQIPAGGCTVTANVTTNVPGSFTNTIPAGALQTTFGGNPNPASAILGVVVPPTVTKQFSPTSIVAGGLSTLTITFGNPNSSAATLTSAFVDTLPVNLSIAPSPNIGGTCAGTVTVTTASLTMANGSSIQAGGCTVFAYVTGSVPGSFNNIILAGDLKTTVGNNANPATATLHISAMSSTALSTSCETTFVANQTFSMMATVTGASPGGNIVFSDGGVPIGGCTVALSAGAASCSTASLPIGMRGLTAAYSGDSNNSSSNSTPLFVMVLDPADAPFRNGFEADIAGCPSM